MRLRILPLLAFVFALVLTLSGCFSTLHMKPSDSTPLKVAKGFARVPIAVLTFGQSEMWHDRERVMRSWLGQHESDLLMAWGSPDQAFDDGRGGRVLVYTERRMRVQPGRATTTSQGSARGQVYGNQVYVETEERSETTYTPPQVQQWEVYRSFRVDEHGRIVQYSWRGL